MKHKKVLLVILILVIFGVVISVGLLNSRANTEPRTVVERFYASWINALSEPTGPIEQRLHFKSTYVTEEFGQEVTRENERGRDNVLCTGKQPGSFTVTDAVINKAGDGAGVDFVADGVDGHVVLVKDTRGWWRISEVDCPVANVFEVAPEEIEPAPSE